MNKLEIGLVGFLVVWFILYCGTIFCEAERRLADAGDKSDFISIDCGNQTPDASSGYKSDAEFIDTGINSQVSGDYEFVLRTVRSFPDSKRNCYTLRPSAGRDNNYLIRARFMYGNYDGKNSVPSFDLYVGVTFWFTVNLLDANHKLFNEIVHKPITDDIYICLVDTGKGTPFISALYLRPLDNSIYNAAEGSLGFISRYHTGSNPPGYRSNPGDAYDRFWSSFPRKNFSEWNFINTSSELTALSNDAYRVPPDFFKTGAMPFPGKTSMSLYQTVSTQEVLYLYWHFAETKRLDVNDTRQFTILSTSNPGTGPIAPKYMEALTVVSPSVRVGYGNLFVGFTIKQTNASTLPPVLNALEIFSVIKLSQRGTNQDDLNAMMDIKTMSTSTTGWQGDPCLPVFPWDGLNCSSNNDANIPRITSLTLSSKGLRGEIMPSIANLTALNYLNLSDNALTGTIPEFLATMPSLQVIDLRRNNLSGPPPVSLVDKVKSGLLSLSLDGDLDPCTSSSCTINSKKQKHKITTPLAASAASLTVLLIAVAVFCTWRWKFKAGSAKGTKHEAAMKSKSQQFTYFEVINMTNNFQTVIGKGAYGSVYHGFLEDGTEVAVKILNPSSALTLKSFQTEAVLLIRVHHRNLVSLVGYCDEGQTMALIYEYMANSDVQRYLSGEHTSTASWRDRLQISIDAAQGLEYLHNGCKPAIIHRDMKTANILLDHKMQAKIADFGMSRIFLSESASHISTNHIAGTPGYLDPEYHVSCRLNEKSDIYSFGVILLELITGRQAIIQGNVNVHITNWVTPLLERGEIDKILDSRFLGDFSINSAWKALETAMACVPSAGIQRPSMAQVLVDLKECLALELAHRNATKRDDQEAAANSSQSFNTIHIDSEANIGPSPR